MKLSFARIVFSVSLSILVPYALLTGVMTRVGLGLGLFKIPFCRISPSNNSYLEALRTECRWYPYLENVPAILAIIIIYLVAYWISGPLKKRFKNKFYMITTFLVVIPILFIADIQYHRAWISTCRSFRIEPDKILSDTYQRCQPIWNPFSWKTDIYELYDLNTGKPK